MRHLKKSIPEKDEGYRFRILTALLRSFLKEERENDVSKVVSVIRNIVGINSQEKERKNEEKKRELLKLNPNLNKHKELLDKLLADDIEENKDIMEFAGLWEDIPADEIEEQKKSLER